MLARLYRAARLHIFDQLAHVERCSQDLSSLTSVHQAASTCVCAREFQTVAKPAQPDSTGASNQLDDLDARSHLTPTAVVERLDRYIVGQEDAKRAVAIALRNRWRRSLLPRTVADEVMPKNILMIGPTGCGKTEIARRLAKLADAPFIKVEATKYTELGYVGRDVEDIIKELVEAAQLLVRSRLRERSAALAANKVTEVIVKALVGPQAPDETLASFRKLYTEGLLDGSLVDLELPAPDAGPLKLEAGQPGMVIFEQFFGNSERSGRGKKGVERQKLKVSEARERLLELEIDRSLSSDAVSREALRAAEQDGIVFIDEIDKIVEPPQGRAATGRISSDGVQRDLLPIIEGSTVQTKHGTVNTDHILFICSGAFHTAKPSDMLAELQGRLPIRVELKGLKADDFYRILTEPQHSMIQQQAALLATEGIALTFTEAALRAMADLAEAANRSLENIGARRLHTIIERVLAEVSFSAPDTVEQARRSGLEAPAMVQYEVDAPYVMSAVADLVKNEELSRYIV
ncbi:ATP-dependent hsl protease ATP-binding subunit hslU [Haematococcus lacustris]